MKGCSCWVTAENDGVSSVQIDISVLGPLLGPANDNTDRQVVRPYARVLTRASAFSLYETDR